MTATILRIIPAPADGPLAPYVTFWRSPCSVMKLGCGCVGDQLTLIDHQDVITDRLHLAEKMG